MAVASVFSAWMRPVSERQSVRGADPARRVGRLVGDRKRRELVRNRHVHPGEALARAASGPAPRSPQARPRSPRRTTPPAPSRQAQPSASRASASARRVGQGRQAEAWLESRSRNLSKFVTHSAHTRLDPSHALRRVSRHAAAPTASPHAKEGRTAVSAALSLHSAGSRRSPGWRPSRRASSISTSFERAASTQDAIDRRVRERAAFIASTKASTPWATRTSRRRAALLQPLRRAGRTQRSKPSSRGRAVRLSAPVDRRRHRGHVPCAVLSHHPGIHVHRLADDARDTMVRDGILVTNATWTVVALARFSPR